MISFIVQTRAACSFKWSNRWDHIAQVSKRNCNCLEAAYEWITTLDLCAIYFLGYLFWTHNLCWTPRFRMTSSNDSGALPPTGPPGIWYSTYDHNRNQILCNIKWYSRCWCLSAFLWHCCSMYFAPWYVWRICLFWTLLTHCSYKKLSFEADPLNLTWNPSLRHPWIYPISLLVNGHEVKRMEHVWYVCLHPALSILKAHAGCNTWLYCRKKYIYHMYVLSLYSCWPHFFPTGFQPLSSTLFNPDIGVMSWGILLPW